MPTYSEALAADPAAFLEYSGQMAGAGTDLGGHRSEFAEKVAALNFSWQDEANDAFNEDVAAVGAHLDGVVATVARAAAELGSAGSTMAGAVTVMRIADAAIRAAGFDIQPAPQVVLGPAQRAAIAAAGPFGGVLEAALRAQALAATFGLRATMAVVGAADATASEALDLASEAMRPLDAKNAPGGGDMHRLADDPSEGGGPDQEGQGDSDQDEGEDEPEPEAGDESGDESGDEPGEQRPEAPQRPERPSMPEDPMGMDDLPLTGLDSPWAGAETAELDEPSGGLASGAAGLGAGGLGGGGIGGGLAAAPAGAGGPALGGTTASVPGAAGGSGQGAGGSPMTGGGGRGGGGPKEDPTERESKLTEDPEEDIWGIGNSDDDPYA